MINITVFKDNCNYKGIRSEGHAEVGPDKKIVCAAISALIQTAIQGIINLSEHEKYHMQTGDLGITVANDICKSKQEIANTILETIALGVETISEMHKENISIYYKESGKHENN